MALFSPDCSLLLFRRAITRARTGTHPNISRCSIDRSCRSQLTSVVFYIENFCNFFFLTNNFDHDHETLDVSNGGLFIYFYWKGVSLVFFKRIMRNTAMSSFGSLIHVVHPFSVFLCVRLVMAEKEVKGNKVRLNTFFLGGVSSIIG